MKYILLCTLLFLFGCAQLYTAKTKASYVVRPDGTKEIMYESDKEQVGLDASVGEKGELKVKVDRAGTQEAVIQSTLMLQLQLVELLKQYLPKPLPVPAGPTIP